MGYNQTNDCVLQSINCCFIGTMSFDYGLRIDTIFKKKSLAKKFKHLWMPSDFIKNWRCSLAVSQSQLFECCVVHRNGCKHYSFFALFGSEWLFTRSYFA